MTDIAYQDYKSDVGKLQRRVRQLEAELAEMMKRGPGPIAYVVAGYKARAEKAEARVAELETILRELGRENGMVIETEHWEELKAAALQWAREREAE